MLSPRILAALVASGGLLSTTAASAQTGGVSGRVTATGTGLPLSGATIEVYRENFDYGEAPLSTASTAADGSYTAAGLPTGSYVVAARASGFYVGETYPDSPCPGGDVNLCYPGASVAVSDGQTTSGIDFALSLGGKISGHVTASDTGQPLSYAYVGFTGTVFPSYVFVVSPATGYYESQWVFPAGTYYVQTYNDDGYVDEMYDNIPCPESSCPPTGGTPVSLVAGQTAANIDFVLSRPVGLGFYTVTPCRVLDSRSPTGPFGGQPLQAKVERTLAVAGVCGIPATAKAVSVNLTATGATTDGHVRLYPGGTPTPIVSALNFRAVQTRANNALAVLGSAGDLALYAGMASGSVHVIVDVNGYLE